MKFSGRAFCIVQLDMIFEKCTCSQNSYLRTYLYSRTLQTDNNSIDGNNNSVIMRYRNVFG